jgi:hypothetical protein
MHRIFTERLPALTAVYARKTHRLVTALQAIGVALGGQAGAPSVPPERRPTDIFIDALLDPDKRQVAKLAVRLVIVLDVDSSV